ncbi:DUF6920 family protein [Pseudidiomarina insulisalsae]|uniref:Uncharacterized protein n=1 Tax=Pseudidiomarina insulisalsae TaxID=575789 RepID=A0A432YDI9_9GAMM|nr:DUF6544 family protein [Pseudidiomarina insulisalsae]RUO58997.1 hypothetical protein CWI71_09255 [Pseudidiomarina insulisalsae]
MTEHLPLPVQRYFAFTLPADYRQVKNAELRQYGELRTDMTQQKWFRFTAEQTFSTTGFEWRAMIQMGRFLRLQVIDQYETGVGSAKVKLFSWLTIARDQDRYELNEAAMHRFLAEGVWFPTNLLPENGVKWRAVDDERAIAHLEHGELEVELEFTFASNGAIKEVFCPGRFARVGKTYRRMPWRGRIADYREVAGMQIPHFAEIGWQMDGQWQWVWRGNLAGAHYKFA